MKILSNYIIISLLLMGNIAFSQDYVTRADISKKTEKTMQKAAKLASIGKLDKALEIYQEVSIEMPTFVDVYAEQAFIFADKKDWTNAQENLQKAINLAPKYQFDWYLMLANYCNQQKDLDCESSNLEKFIELEPNDRRIPRLQERIDKNVAKKALLRKYEDIQIEKMPDAINHPDYSQYKALLTVDEKAIIFTRLVNNQEDFYISNYIDSAWTEAVPIEELNTPLNEGAHTITADGKYMLYTRCDVPGKYQSCDIYFTYKKNNSYADPLYLDFLDTYAWESQPAYSADGNTILFSSNRKGGQGKKDLYIVERINGEWGPVKNMGDKLNTVGDEASPFLHVDGETLYFMSDGHPGFGGMDLFMSQKNDAGEWQVPINLGSSINSDENEGALSIDALGMYAYFSKTSKLGEAYHSDIYRFLLPEAFKPIATSYAKITVTDAISGQALLATAKISNEKDTELTVPIEQDGSLIMLKAKETYQIQVEKEGYLFYSDFIQLSKTDIESAYVKDVVLYPITQEVMAPPTIMKNVLFDTGNAQLKESSYKELDILYKILKENTSLQVQINGHTDNVGKPQDNQELSLSRAESVKTYLIQKGIQANRIQTKGFGETKPIASNDLEKGREMNRRTEFEIK